ncbi:GGDEF domain-containing protein [Dactylosporangium vinaceum]|uniref:GGDEF domain-containing protein n=1 Tax=Dactylosporangium vinaceum TaxID=53362 RepID=A0ABV5MJQ1_9ACTN|nr:GGDEF domain-containing protein [Dactylosporangium vinaceum]
MARARLQVIALGFAVVLMVGFFIVPDGSLLQVVWQVGIGWVAAGAIVLGVLRHRPAVPALWWLIAAGVAGNAAGIGVETVLTRLQVDAGFPSWADAAYLSLYPLTAGGLMMLIRHRSPRRNWTTAVDATTLTTGIGLLAWIFMIQPAATDPSIGLLGHIVSVAYPIGDIVLLAMTVRLLLDGAGRNVALRWVLSALLCFLGGDSAWVVVNQVNFEPGPLAHKALASVFLAGYFAFAAAALHPDVRAATRPAPARPVRPGRALLAVLTATSLIAPVLLLAETAMGQVDDALAIGIGCVALFLLVLARMSQLLTQLDVQSQKVRELAVTDELTGLPNRRAWNAELPRALERSRREGRPLTVALLDLDHFKRFNDSYGHPAGDRLLKEAAAAWQAHLRTVDTLARYGGEEFIVMLPDATRDAAHQIIDRMRAATPLGQTFSAGVATLAPGEHSDELLVRADAALYEAKRAGRDRVAVAAG